MAHCCLVHRLVSALATALVITSQGAGAPSRQATSLIQTSADPTFVEVVDTALSNAEAGPTRRALMRAEALQSRGLSTSVPAPAHGSPGVGHSPLPSRPPYRIPDGEIIVNTDNVNTETEAVIDEDKENAEEGEGRFKHNRTHLADSEADEVHTTPEPGGFCMHRRRNIDGCPFLKDDISSRRRCQSSANCGDDNVDGYYEDPDAHRRR